MTNTYPVIYKLSAREFLNQWDKFTSNFTKSDNVTLTKDYLDKWEESSLWTKEILGHGSSNENEKSPFGKDLSDEFSLKPRNEEWKIDLALAREDNFWCKVLSSSQETEISGFYPTSYEIIIEHENNIDSCWEEMIKLTRFRAKLKVLITYAYVQRNTGQHCHTIKRSKENFSSIIRQANDEILEDISTEYVLIIGERHILNEEESTVQWHQYVFRADGKLTFLSNSQK